MSANTDLSGNAALALSDLPSSVCSREVKSCKFIALRESGMIGNVVCRTGKKVKT